MARTKLLTVRRGRSPTRRRSLFREESVDVAQEVALSVISVFVPPL